jgi:uncharacterized oxidoreductase
MAVPAEQLNHLVRDIFERGGCSRREASGIARRLVGADLAGHPSHGVIRVPGYVERLASGQLVADRTITVVTENDCLAVVDGRYGFGQTVGRQAVELGIVKARASGVAVIGLRRAGHLGRIADWAEMAADAGLVSVHFVNAAGSSLVAPFGSKERRFSTNPIAIGVPQARSEPLLSDFATSVVAEGKARVALNGGPPLPPASLVGPEGQLTSDPQVLYGPVEPGQQPSSRDGPGALRSMGDHKGSALSLACELLAGVLTGSGTSSSTGVFGNGMLSIYLSPDHFAAPAFVAQATDFADHVRRAAPIDPASPTVVPGDPERLRRQQQLAEGIELAEGTRRQLIATAEWIGADARSLVAPPVDGRPRP